MARKATVVEEVQVLGEKNGLRDSARSSEEVIVERTEPDPETKAIAEQYGVSEKDIVEAREFAASLSLEDVVVILKRVLATHDEDPNFPYENLRRIKEFLATPDALEAPEKHERLIGDMSLLAALVTNNSPYSEVRAVVDNHDDPSTPVSTLRAWTIGIFFSVLLAFVNQLFSIRQPAIPFPSHVAQLLAFPIGKSWERWMPDAALRLPFTRRVVRLNPGRFSKKEHMLITIMATTSSSLPVSNGIIWMQVLPDYLNQQYAKSFGYIFLNSFATSFVGYGLAGIVRRFLVYPASCVWPASLATIALNSALQNEENQPVGGPLRRVWTISRYRFFMLFFAAMFLYFWFPNFLFQALSSFSWMTWFAPNNRELAVLTGMQNGVGLLNPIPTLDWNIVTTFHDPLVVPSFTTFNMSAGLLVSIIISLAIWYSNSWNTGYLPINTNQVFDHFGQPYNISNVLDERGSFDERKYASYSAPYIGSMFTVLYGAYFSMYAGFATYAVLHIRREIKLGLRNLLRCFTFPWRKLRKARGKGGAGKPRPEEQQHTDVHNRLMAAYPEVSEWWYLGVLVVSLIFGVLGLTLYPTFTSPLVVFYGIALALIVIIPNGIIASSTGIEIPQDILAGILGSIIARGNPLSILYFRSYGFITLAHATAFAKDLKLAHYVKIPPRVTFVGQMVSTFISTLICACVMMYQVGIPDVCTPNAPNRYFCPGVKVGATDIILSGTVGSLRIFGVQYPWLLMGFLYGAVVVVGLWGLKRWWPGSRALRQVHSMVFLVGSIQLIPYNFAYSLPTVPVAWFSWIYIRGRYPGFWSKYNFVLSSALSAGIAISALAMAFTVQWADVKLDWWGNTQQAQGCEKDPCLLRTLGPGERFFPWWDGSKSPAP